jgi:hypothetical protein
MTRKSHIVGAGGGLVLACAWLAGCSPSSSGSGKWMAPAGEAAAASAEKEAGSELAPERALERVVLARTQLTNQTGTRVRVTMTMVEVPKDSGAAARWWWGDSVTLTASYTTGYEFRARLDERLPTGGARSALIRVQTLLGTRVEGTEWYNIVGPVPKRIDFVREPKGEGVVPACYPPSTIEPLARELWPVEQP